MKRVLIFVGIAVLGFLLFAGCGDDSKKEVTITTTQKESAKGVVIKVSTLKNVKANPEDQTVFANLNEIFGDAQQLLSAAQTSGSLKSALLQTVEGCVTQSGNTITYNNCNYGSTGYSYVINGTITTSGDVFKVDLTIDIDAIGSGYGTKQKMVYKGEITITATKIDGNLDYDIFFDVQGATSGTYKLNIKYDNIGLDASGCPTSGKSSIKYDVNAQGQSQSGTIDLEYGPACGDVKMYK